MKKIIIIAFVFMFATANSAFAHTGLEDSNPANGEVVTEQLNEITLTFEGKLEQSSTFELKNSTGETIPVDNITIDEEKLAGTLSTPLDNGNYEINWNIVGVDGHQIEGDIPFTVEVAASEKQEDGEKIEQATPPTAKPTTVEQTEEVKSSSNVVPFVVVGLIVIIGGVFLLLRRKK
ncbi:LPXTG cell wall anchor domain-containing protein [Psychrobacillus glaciei]|uniref:LPXTG cell wall anchor domain-containing protein n=1 Tax=Psychrobacillus glaciei TaxID=2283160 RepID=A0A5J6SW32_9BACI|nr:copper resistance protein CopC [Psychrobacillus glaciei]QFG01275.1 LPXTG cell wall anchor domain-containing protein [Psychrobacillus glaciei]